METSLTLLPSSHLTNFFCCWLVAIGIIAVSGWLVHGWTSRLAAGAAARGWLEIPAGAAVSVVVSAANATATVAANHRVLAHSPWAVLGPS